MEGESIQTETTITTDSYNEEDRIAFFQRFSEELVTGDDDTQLTNEKSIETPVLINSDSEEDLVSLLRRDRKKLGTGQNATRVITRHGNWESLDFKLRERPGSPEKKGGKGKGSAILTESKKHRKSSNRRKKPNALDPESAAQTPPPRRELVPGLDAQRTPNSSRPPKIPKRKGRIRDEPDTALLLTQPTARSPALGQSRLAPRTQSEEREAGRVAKLEGRRPAREDVVPEFKWGYAIRYVDGADIILDDEDDARVRAATTHRTFADREKANEYLDRKTSPAAVGGLEAVVRRAVSLEGPERLLRVDIELANGERHLMWVERGLVALRDLKERKRREVQWQPRPRPRFPHYVVTCDLIRYDASPISRSDDDDDDNDKCDGIGAMDQNGRPAGSTGLSVELRIKKLPPVTFTFREMANEHAGMLFLEKCKVDRRFAVPLDVYWWQCNAVPEHKEAVARARRADGLYEATLDSQNMNSRLGWDQILVHVHEVDDVIGPVNF
ncbi:hypothetical protein SAMD00023353_2600470 [Rosellinia necatrix]|uniref:Uncharacterized protein n=1 Tax=Rosellinia necatrix TaxID=77044 RepID=A0A1W2TH95_ROSNE|nr:hypothetical protein SAMD00023353_2600470 [Rosellinia necatrix]